MDTNRNTVFIILVINFSVMKPVMTGSKTCTKKNANGSIVATTTVSINSTIVSVMTVATLIGVAKMKVTHQKSRCFKAKAKIP